MSDILSAADLRQFKSHEKVSAGRILDMPGKIEPGTIPGVLFSVEARQGPIRLNREADMFKRYWPVVGDYFIRYGDGYESISPKQAFEDGHTETAIGADGVEAIDPNLAALENLRNPTPEVLAAAYGIAGHSLGETQVASLLAAAVAAAAPATVNADLPHTKAFDANTGHAAVHGTDPTKAPAAFDVASGHAVGHAVAEGADATS